MLLQQNRWRDVTEFITDTNEGRAEVKFFGIDLVYAAVEYRAPASLITFIFNFIEREHGNKIRLDSALLIKALYLPTNGITNRNEDENKRKWECAERKHVAVFLSDKIRVKCE